MSFLFFLSKYKCEENMWNVKKCEDFVKIGNSSLT